MKNRDILISGCGIAGMTLAYWLRRWGFNPTIIEQHNELRQGGYLIDFFGLGVSVANRMNILPQIANKDIRIPEVTFINSKGTRTGGLNLARLRQVMSGQSFTLLRDDLSRIIFSKIKNQVEILFGHSIVAVDQTEQKVIVTLSNGIRRRI